MYKALFRYQLEKYFYEFLMYNFKFQSTKRRRRKNCYFEGQILLNYPTEIQKIHELIITLFKTVISWLILQWHTHCTNLSHKTPNQLLFKDTNKWYEQNHSVWQRKRWLKEGTYRHCLYILDWKMEIALLVWSSESLYLW